MSLSGKAWDDTGIDPAPSKGSCLTLLMFPKDDSSSKTPRPSFSRGTAWSKAQMVCGSMSIGRLVNDSGGTENFTNSGGMVGKFWRGTNQTLLRIMVLATAMVFWDFICARETRPDGLSFFKARYKRMLFSVISIVGSFFLKSVRDLTARDLSAPSGVRSFRAAWISASENRWAMLRIKQTHSGPILRKLFSAALPKPCASKEVAGKQAKTARQTVRFDHLSKYFSKLVWVYNLVKDMLRLLCGRK